MRAWGRTPCRPRSEPRARRDAPQTLSRAACAAREGRLKASEALAGRILEECSESRSLLLPIAVAKPSIHHRLVPWIPRPKLIPERDGMYGASGDAHLRSEVSRDQSVLRPPLRAGGAVVWWPCPHLS